MISTMKTALITAALVIGAAATLIPLQAQAAPRNGYGVVYHTSDCGRYAVRQYAWGGDGAGSACGYWIDEDKRTALWNYGDRNHNYTNRELCALMIWPAGQFFDNTNYSQPTCW